MICAWDAFVSILPLRMRSDVDTLGRTSLQQLRLRLGKAPMLEMRSGRKCLPDVVTEEDLRFVVQTASRYSPWASTSLARGFLTGAGGHRIGVCGETVVQRGDMQGIRSVTSLCLRVARQLTEICVTPICLKGSVLIVGPPGSGKTTLLREVIRQRSNGGQAVAVVDERGELFPPGSGFQQGSHTDVLTLCGKREGIDCVLRAMSPAAIAVDEITQSQDCVALQDAAWCGVELLATVHAHGKRDLLSRRIYRPLVSAGLFDTLLVMQPDQSYEVERMDIC